MTRSSLTISARSSAPSIHCGKCGRAMGGIGDVPMKFRYSRGRFTCFKCIRDANTQRTREESLKKARREKAKWQQAVAPVEDEIVELFDS
jgi:hypothetical protein